MFDDVHRRHGETGAVHETGDVAIETDVVEVVLRGLDLAGIFLGGVVEGGDVRMTVKSVVVEIEFRVEREDTAVRRGDERIDLDHGAITLDEEAVERGEELAELLRLVTGKTELGGELAHLVGLETEERVDRLMENLLRGVLGDLLDVHAAFGAGDDDGRLAFAIHEDGEVILFFDFDTVGDHHLADELALFTGLVRDEDLADHLAGDVRGFVRSLHEVDTAFEAVLEGALATTTGMHLGLHDDVRSDLGGGGLGLFGRIGDLALGRGHAEFFKEFLGLVFVDVHGGKQRLRTRRSGGESGNLRSHSDWSRWKSLRPSQQLRHTGTRLLKRAQADAGARVSRRLRSRGGLRRGGSGSDRSDCRIRREGNSVCAVWPPRRPRSRPARASRRDGSGSGGSSRPDGR